MAIFNRLLYADIPGPGHFWHFFIEGFGGAICYDMQPMANYSPSSKRQEVYDKLFREVLFYKNKQYNAINVEVLELLPV
jgi:hypothetical protein